MGTTLTGTTPQDTYDSLIKVTDNGPISGTAKFLSDGLGNDSVLALSTTAVGVSETSPLGKLHVKTADTGVSSVSAQGNLLVLEDTENGLSILSSTAGAGYILFGDSADNDVAGIIYDHSANAMIFNTNAAERMRITSAGNVGIGTSAPAEKLDVNGRIRLVTADYGVVLLRTSDFFYSRLSAEGVDAYTNTNNAAPIIFKTGGTERVRIQAAGGISFNGDTAAANALDDYEEGTFTATAFPSTSGTITLSVNTCTYTKIGRQVTIKGQLLVGSVASPVGTVVTIAGLPFTSIGSVAGRGSGAATYFPAVGSGSVVVNYQLQGATEWNFVLTASAIAAGDEFYITLTYFV